MLQLPESAHRCPPMTHSGPTLRTEEFVTRLMRFHAASLLWTLSARMKVMGPSLCRTPLHSGLMSQASSAYRQRNSQGRTFGRERSAAAQGFDAERPAATLGCPHHKGLLEGQGSFRICASKEPLSFRPGRSRSVCKTRTQFEPRPPDYVHGTNRRQNADAEALCAKLHSSGGACMVQKN